MLLNDKTDKIESITVRKHSKMVGDDWHLNSITIKKEKEIKIFKWNNWIKKDIIHLK